MTSAQSALDAAKRLAEQARGMREDAGPGRTSPTCTRDSDAGINRHMLDRIRPKMPRKDANAVALPHVDVGADIDGMNAGQAIRKGDDFGGVPLTATVTVTVLSAENAQGVALSTDPQAVAQSLRTITPRTGRLAQGDHRGDPRGRGVRRTYGVEDMPVEQGDPRTIRMTLTRTSADPGRPEEILLTTVPRRSSTWPRPSTTSSTRSPRPSASSPPRRCSRCSLQARRHEYATEPVILPIHPWAEQGRGVWLRAEELGFGVAYTYDHLSWREPFRAGT